MRLPVDEFIKKTNMALPFFNGQPHWRGIQIYIQKNNEIYSDDFEIKHYAKQYILRLYYQYSVKVQSTPNFNPDCLKKRYILSGEPSTPFTPHVAHSINCPCDSDYGFINLFEYISTPRPNTLYYIHMEYAGYKSNSVPFQIIYRPYPRDIYAGS